MENQLFNDKYRIESIRLKHWDYSSCGAYFITICTKNRECCFGEIINGKMILSGIGGIVSNEWQKTQQIRKNVELDEWVVMPNHFHGIVIINENINPVETCCGMSLPQKYNRFSKPISQSLSMIINHFKSAVTRQCHKIGFTHFSWQPRFYEHIIRNEIELNTIRNYIINNPTKWQFDRNNKSHNSHV